MSSYIKDTYDTVTLSGTSELYIYKAYYTTAHVKLHTNNALPPVQEKIGSLSDNNSNSDENVISKCSFSSL